MTLATAEFSDFDRAPPDIDLPPAAHTFAPTTLDETARILDTATQHRAPVLLWGAGTHQGYGHRLHAEVVVTSQRMDRVVTWEPDDLTLVVEAGARVGRIEEMLADRRQTAALPETAPEATLGGVIAAGVSGYRRARYGPTRDRVLEVTLVTGDGRVVKGGGRVVKNVSGYDLPRLATGSMGALGLIGMVCLKLWPLPEMRATVPVSDPAAAWHRLHRPLAVLETAEGSWAYLQGMRADVETQATRVGDQLAEGHVWPNPVTGPVVFSLRVPPAHTGEARRRIPSGWPFVAQHGVGEVTAAAPDAESLVDLRAWAESVGGSLVLVSADDGVYERFDPWGRPPSGLDLQRRIVAAFDPARVLNPGRLPGRN